MSNVITKLSSVPDADTVNRKRKGEQMEEGNSKRLCLMKSIDQLSGVTQMTRLRHKEGRGKKKTAILTVITTVRLLRLSAAGATVDVCDVLPGEPYTASAFVSRRLHVIPSRPSRLEGNGIGGRGD